MEERKLIKILQYALQVMFNLIKHLPCACPVEVCTRKQAYKDVQTLLSEWKGGQREKKKNGTVHQVVLTETFLDMLHHFELTSFAVSKNLEARGEFC